MTTGTTVPTTGTEVVVVRRVLTIDWKTHLPRIEVSCERGERQREKDAQESDQRDYSTQKDSVMVAYRQLRRRLEARIRDTTITVVGSIMPGFAIEVTLTETREVTDCLDLGSSGLVGDRPW